METWMNECKCGWEDVALDRGMDGYFCRNLPGWIDR